ncbi:septum site-determining protein MinC [Natranaerobius thermophilus]|uniref:Probable septum site-determining protein MinC n=1 Tax=Natranaerobius thermophilus (strain ATCC BAA-1301 / DSM 18059 / JW/NM-WN-LF) TaxID=457570 RepID=B2A6A4_NATTJ|nr:septum site-determining protein MinC [Natranaerobius thermophilus]ACB84115.1 septum site-determining protein MinC [Natranaerobius thermophilus JW/NM-WN-LF]
MINKEHQPVEFKGTKKGLLILLDGEYPFDELLEIMYTKLQQSENFFQEGQVKVQVKNKQLNSNELNLITRLFSEKTRLELGEIISDSGEVLVSFPSTFRKELGKQESQDYRINNSLVIRRTIRSGQKVEFPGTIIIIGNVNPGAELIANGDIIVFGELKGICHAGVDGDSEASVMALRLMASQLRIADIVSRAPDDAQPVPQYPERAFINGNQIVVEDIDQKTLTDKL